MTRLALLWHMHQPFYQDLLTGEHLLPWVRLHALKDYWGMVALLREFPSVKVTFNLVPSLLVQLEAFARDEARDRHLELGLKAADRLSAEERAFCIEQFFHAHRAQMIDPYPRYAELLARRSSQEAQLNVATQAGQFSADDIRDLQVWHKLVWMDAEYRERDQRVRGLIAKGRGFTEEDKILLRGVELELLQKVIPEYREAAERGQVELSTSPFYHPILPLLCDTDVYLRTHPGSRMPREPFRHPEDAAEQLARASAFQERLFGRAPTGLWPSEGSVSDAMIPLAAAAGFRWMATDEEILSRTLGRELGRDARGHSERPEMLYRPYMLGQPGREVACGFRDHALSDLIGFAYASRSAEAAAEDFVARLAEAGRRYRMRTGGEDATIFVILDGENAWEHYEGQGRPFLRALYGRLAAQPDIQTVTMAEACAGASARLPSVFPGSWINGDFYIWIGHADDRRAWDQLVDARRALEAPPAGVSDSAIQQAREEMLIAEGSDWFWWYGDDHSSDQDVMFDELFRRHVRNVYRMLETPVPEQLFVTNITTEPPTVAIDRPTGFIEPAIDGEVTSYFEWIYAGGVGVVQSAGAMHRGSSGETGLTEVQFGFNLDYLFIRVDAATRMSDVLASGMELSIDFLKPAGTRVVVCRAGPGHKGQLGVRGPGETWETRDCAQLEVGIGSILELKIPFGCLNVRAPDAIAFIVALKVKGVEVEHSPQQGPIELTVPDREFPASTWMA